MKKTIFLLVIVMHSVIFAANKYKNTFDYIQKTKRLWGITRVKINDDKSVTLFDAQETGYGRGLMLQGKEKEWVESVTLYPGKSCLLTDGDHAFITYKFVKLEKGKIIFDITDKFDATSFGKGIKEETKTMDIYPYKIRDVDWKKFPRKPQKISWEDAVKIIRSGKLISASQSHSLIVVFHTKDYKYYITKEPKIDDIGKLINEIDPKRENIFYVTE